MLCLLCCPASEDDIDKYSTVQCSTVQYSAVQYTYVSSVLVLYLLCCLAAIITHETYKV